MDKIVCIGKNYAEHAAELGDKPVDKPVLFLKPPSILRVATSDEPLRLTMPKDAGELHFETEVVLRLDKGGYQIPLEKAEGLIGAVTLGLDMTLRDRQRHAKDHGLPWTTSKVFPDAAVIGPWIRISEFPDYLSEQFTFTLNGELRQQCNASKMIYSPAQCVSYISHYFPLRAGDIIYTGTPAGVGAVSLASKGILNWGVIRYEVTWNE